MITCETSIFLLLLVNTVSPQILSSSALNCDFGSTACAWRNGSNGQEDTGDFAPGQNLHMDDFHQITSMRPDKDDMFIYSFAFGGRQTALLISDVISCQLGGASLKYWYWKTGNDVTLDICIRQPPGNREPANLRCYDGLSTTHGQQWIFRSVELPPISQPFELMFRTTFTAPLDILALDDIEYEAILCESSNQDASQGAGGGFGPPDDVKENINGGFPLFGDSSTPVLGLGLPFSQPNFFANDLGRANEPVKRAPISPPTFAANTDPVKYPFDDDHFGYSRASGAKTYDIGKEAGNGNKPSSNRGPSTPRIGPQFDSRCPPIDCTFDDQTFCDYVTVVSDSDLLNRENSELKDWTLTNQRVENTLTGIPYDLSQKGGYVFAGGVTNPSDSFVLSTRTPVVAPGASRLDFFVYLAGVAGRLRVCFDSLTNCPFEISGKQIEVSARQWNNYFITVPEGSHSIHFVADRLKKNYAIGLDNIQLLSKFGMSAQAC